MREMAGEHHVLRCSPERVDDPVGGISRLETVCRRERCKRVALLPICFGGLARAQLSAMPDDVGLRAMLCRFPRQHVNLGAAPVRERPHRIHVRAYRIAVVNEKQHVFG